jgi:NitT/TauT family transport system substrate-binding protein
LHITLIENFRAVFYTPFYAALSLDAFAAEGVDVAIRMSPDPAATLQQLSAGGGTVSWGGPMRLLREHDRNPDSTAVGFCEVIGRDPFFLVGRAPNAAYRPRDLVGQRVAVVSEVPTPWICLQQDLRLAGVDPAAITLAPARTMAENAALLRSGDLDVIQVFQPFARELLDDRAGHVWYAAASRGLATYTTLNTTRELVDRDPDIVLRMTRAMYRTQRWIDAHDGAALAHVVAAWFPDLPERTLAACCAEYKALGLWNRTPLMAREGFDWLRDAMQACGDIGRRIPFEECIDMQFASRTLAEPVADL